MALSICVLRTCLSFDVDPFSNAWASGDWVTSPVLSPGKGQSCAEQGRTCQYPILTSRTHRKLFEGAARIVYESVDPWRTEYVLLIP